jgi:hypothetical protein
MVLERQPLFSQSGASKASRQERLSIRQVPYLDFSHSIHDDSGFRAVTSPLKATMSSSMADFIEVICRPSRVD